MNKTSRFLLRVCLCLFYSAAMLAWQDDAELFLRDPLEQFSTKEGIGFLPHARSEIRLGRYLERDRNHAWRGALLGDVGLFSFGTDFLWRWSLNMETLADDRNDIHFRLVQVYYQSITGIFWHVGPGAWSLTWNHRCSHGTDDALASRILIRAGPESSYELPLSYKKLSFLLKASLAAYVLGQNNDFANQSRGQSQLSFQVSWPIHGALSMRIASSFGEELIAQGTTFFFPISAPGKNLRLRPFGGARLGLSVEGERVKSDYSLVFSHISDTGLGSVAKAHQGLSFDITFYW